MDWHGHERTALLNNLNHPVCRSWITECSWPWGTPFLLVKKPLKTRDPEIPTNKQGQSERVSVMYKSKFLCHIPSCRGAWQHEYCLDSTEYLNAYALYFPMLKLRCITTAIFLFSNHTGSAFQSFRHCVAVAFCRTPRTWKISMSSTWCISFQEIGTSKGHVKWCEFGDVIKGQRSTRTQGWTNCPTDFWSQILL